MLPLCHGLSPTADNPVRAASRSNWRETLQGSLTSRIQFHSRDPSERVSVVHTPFQTHRRPNRAWSSVNHWMSMSSRTGASQQGLPDEPQCTAEGPGCSFTTTTHNLSHILYKSDRLPSRRQLGGLHPQTQSDTQLKALVLVRRNWEA